MKNGTVEQQDMAREPKKNWKKTFLKLSQCVTTIEESQFPAISLLLCQEAKLDRIVRRRVLVRAAMAVIIYML